MRSARPSPIVPTAEEGAMTMAQMMEIMRALQVARPAGEDAQRPRPSGQERGTQQGH